MPYEVLDNNDPTIRNLTASDGNFYIDVTSNFIRVVPPVALANLNTRRSRPAPALLVATGWR
jgi:hypothetical protein